MTRGNEKGLENEVTLLLLMNDPRYKMMAVGGTHKLRKALTRERRGGHKALVLGEERDGQKMISAGLENLCTSLQHSHTISHKLFQ